MNDGIDNKYNDIINLPHHTSSRHPRMSAINRAAQFSPFAALTGHEAAICETARLTGRKRVLCEDEIAIISEKLQILSEAMSESCVTVTYFVKDKTKDGGEYVTKSLAFARVDKDRGEVVFLENERIPICDISEIDGEIFSKLGIIW